MKNSKCFVPLYKSELIKENFDKTQSNTAKTNEVNNTKVVFNGV